MWRLIILVLPLAVFAQEVKDPAAGHSYHGEAFNEGPRQEAFLMTGVGSVQFDISSGSAKTKLFFNQGVGQLHGFWYLEAERSFRQAAVTDSECAMVYWGMAMANIINEKRARGFLSKAYLYIESASEREKMYIDSYAVRIGLPKDEKGLGKYRKDPKAFKVKEDEKARRGKYVKELEKIVLKYPDDIEAKAFLVMNLWNNTYKGHKLNSHVAVDSLAKEILAKEPLHPTHHYRIHLWDKKNPEVALNSAANCGPGAPSIAHMWHMPGHIYSRLHRFADAAWQQEASARTDHRHMMRDLILPDQIHNFAHNNEWLSRNLMNLGDVNRAYALIRNMLELPRHPKYNTFKKGSANYGRQRLLQLLTHFELWKRAIELKDTPYLGAGEKLDNQMKRLRLIGRAHFSLGQLEEGNATILDVEKLQKKIIAQAEKDYAKKQKEKAAKAKASKDNKAKEVAKDSKKPKDRDKSKPEEIAEDTLKELTLLKALAEGTLAQVIKDFKDLSGLDKWLQAKLKMSLGEFEEALKLTEKAYKDNTNKVIHMARHVEALFKAGKKKEARQVFNKLRLVSEFTDLSVRPMQRLAAIAQEFKYPQDWRLQQKVAEDLGRRPSVKSLGPFRWSPVKAPKWKLPNAEGKSIDFSSLNGGQPYIVIFYLGAECLHCVEQLNAFAPEKDKFEAAGMKLIAVSLENIFELKKSVDKYSENGHFPFPIVADNGLEVFKKYKCYDDFEKMALHGTFLVDGQGDIRWLDISYEPFTDTKFLLEESKRLLSRP